MKLLLSSFAFLLLLTSATPKELSSPKTLKKALELNIVSATIKGNDESPHYFNPLILELKNLTHVSLSILIMPGDIFKSDDPEYQDILITKFERIEIKAGTTLRIPLFGMCIQEFNSAPGSEQKYSLAERGGDDLSLLANRINKEKAFNIAAQQAVWSVTDGYPLDKIGNLSDEQSDQAREMVAGLESSDTTVTRGLTIRRNNNNGLIKRQMDGNFKYRISKESEVHIALFNEQNIVVKELFNDTAVTAGEHDFRYTMNEYIDPTKYYYVRLIIDGEIKINFEMKPRS